MPPSLLGVAVQPLQRLPLQADHHPDEAGPWVSVPAAMDAVPGSGQGLGGWAAQCPVRDEVEAGVAAEAAALWQAFLLAA